MPSQPPAPPTWAARFFGLFVAAALIAPPMAVSAGTTRAVVAVSGDPGTVAIVDLADGSVQTLTDPSFIQPRRVAITADGKFAGVTNAGSDTVSWIDLEAGTVLGTTVVGLSPRGIALTGSQAIVTLNGAHDAVKIIDIASLPILPTDVVTPDGPGIERGDNPEGVGVAPGGRFAVVALNGANMVRYLDLGVVPAAFLPGGTTVTEGPFDVAFAPVAGHVLVSRARGDSLAVVDLRGLPLVPTDLVTAIVVGQGPRGIGVSADGRVAVVATRERKGQVAVVNLRNQAVTTAAMAGNPFGAAVTSTPGGWIGVLARETLDPGGIRIVDLPTGAKLLDVAVGDRPQGVAITPIQVPKAKLLTSPGRGAVPLAIALDATQSSDPDGTLLRFTYRFGDGTPPLTKFCASDPTCATADHTYTKVGRHRAIVQVMDDDGGVAQASRIVAAAPNRPPTAAIKGNRRKGPVPLTISFESRAADRDGTITGFCWNFGDGAPGCHATAQDVDHVFVTPGRYRVTLTVTDDSGGTATAEYLVQAQ